MNRLDSDELRRQLSENNAAMNTLTEDNQKIVELLAQRGLKAIEPDNNDVAIHPCVMQLDKLGEALFRTQFEPKRREEIALTAEELKTGGWWCADVSAECQRALSNRKLEFQAIRWDGKYHFCFMRSGRVYRGLSRELARVTCDDKQIHRIGNNFYWGAASDQAN